MGNGERSRRDESDEASDEYALVVDSRESFSSFVDVLGANVNNLYPRKERRSTTL